MKKLLTLTVMMFLSVIIIAQNKTITGEVIEDQTGNPLTGVEVTVKGTDIQTKTDAAGQYSLDVPKSINTLTFKLMGYQTREVSVKGMVLNIIMSSDWSDLFDMSLKELIEIKVVSALNKEEKLSEAPATIIVITEDDIKERGYTEFFDIFNDLPGFGYLWTKRFCWSC